MSPEIKIQDPTEFRVVSAAVYETQPLNGVKYTPEDIGLRLRQAAEDYNVAMPEERVQELAAIIAADLNSAPRTQRQVEGDLEEHEDFGDNFPNRAPSRVQ